MQKTLLTLTLALLTTPAFAADQNAVFCNREKKEIRFIVQGKQAEVTGMGVTEKYDVAEVMQFSKEDLADMRDQVRAIKEPIKAAIGYNLTKKGYNDGIALVIVEGRSGNRYLTFVAMSVEVLGSTHACKK